MTALFDPDNPVLRLCAEGMMAEGSGGPDAARALFERAWAMRTDRFEASVAAHYLARHQASVEDTLRWNRTALEEALLLDDGRERALLPSLHLNLGKALEDAGRRAEARAQYELARACADALDDALDDGYGQMIRRGIEAGLERTRAG